jgi:twitching motility protein PilT
MTISGPPVGGFIEENNNVSNPKTQKSLLSSLEDLEDSFANPTVQPTFGNDPQLVEQPMVANSTPRAQPAATLSFSSPALPSSQPAGPISPSEVRVSRPAETAPLEVHRVRERQGPSVPPLTDEPGIIELSPDEAGENDSDFIALDDALLYLLEKGGSDLHLSVGLPPMIRVLGDMEKVEGYPVFTGQSLQATMYGILNERQKQKFEETKELDFAYSMPGAARFRVNMFQQKGSTGAVLRTIPWEIKSLEELGMPPALGNLANLPNGLVLVTGPTGSGKSTTLAAIVDQANRTRSAHIMTIEDPVEFVHQHRRSVVNQREVGEDTWSFAAALKHALRQDPDIILVGEMRDLETISIALTAAETGHLVFGTLHTSSAGSTIDRIIDVFPPAQQAQIRTQIGSSLQAVICQALCKTADGKGRAAALEIMIATPAIRNLIREGKLQSIPSALQTGSRFGMQTLNQDLARLVKEGRITYEVALDKTSDAQEIDQLLGKSSDKP